MQTVLDMQGEFLRLQKQQMYAGKGKDGGFMAPYRWGSYADFKQGLNSTPPAGIRDNYLTGDFYSGFILKQVSSDSYMITSVDDKTEYIKSKARTEIFGLNSESKAELKPDFQVSLVKRIKDATER